jgi:hypothetical protein
MPGNADGSSPQLPGHSTSSASVGSACVCSTNLSRPQQLPVAPGFLTNSHAGPNPHRAMMQLGLPARTLRRSQGHLRCASGRCAPRKPLGGLPGLSLPMGSPGCPCPPLDRACRHSAAGCGASLHRARHVAARSAFPVGARRGPERQPARQRSSRTHKSTCTAEACTLEARKTV